MGRPQFQAAFFRDRKKRDTYATKHRLALIEESDPLEVLLDKLGRRRERLIERLRAKSKAFRRYTKTLDKLYDSGDVTANWLGVLDVDLGGLIDSLPGLRKLDEDQRFAVLGITLKFIDRVNARTFGKKKSSRGYVRGAWWCEQPEGETYTLSDVKTALRLT